MIGGQGLGSEHVQNRVADMAAIERGQQRRILDQRAATGIDQRRPLRQQRQPVRIHQVAGCRSIGQQQDQDFGPAQGAVQFGTGEGGDARAPRPEADHVATSKPSPFSARATA